MSQSRRLKKPKFGLARALSKLGYCSRSQAWDLIEASRVRVNGQVCRNPEAPCDLEKDRLAVDNQLIRAAAKVYLMLNKPRGLVTTRADEAGRGTVYQCLADGGFPWLAPVGRLDKASEGLLLFTNDSAWAARILAPESHLDKVYHAQVDCLADAPLLRRLVSGVATSQGELLSLKQARLLRRGSRNSWLQIVIDEGKNRQIRRVLEVFGVQVLRLIRIAIGPLKLGELPKGQCRQLTGQEVSTLGATLLVQGSGPAEMRNG